MPTKGICLIWSRGRLFSPSLSCRGQGIGKHRGTISSWHKRTAGRNLVVHRHGTTLRQSVQRYRCRLYFSLFFSHFDIKAGKSPEDIIGKEAFHLSLVMSLSNCRRVFVQFIAFKPILHIKHVSEKSNTIFRSLTGVLTGRKTNETFFTQLEPLFKKKSQQTRYLETFQAVNRLMYSVPSQLYSNLQSGFLVTRMTNKIMLITWCILQPNFFPQ